MGLGAGYRKVSCLCWCLQIYTSIKGSDTILRMETNGGQLKFGPLANIDPRP